MSDLHASLTIPFLPTQTFSPGSLEVEPGGEINQPALLDYFPDNNPNAPLLAFLSMARKGTAHFRIRYHGPGPLAFVPETIEENDLELQFINKGERVESRRLTLTFDGETELILPGRGAPRPRHITTFYNQAGESVPPPHFRAHPRAYVHTEPVFGAILLDVDDPFLLLQIRYTIPGGTIPDGGYTPIPFQVRAPGRVTQETLNRRATLNRVNFHHPPRKQRKVEVKRFGVVDRIFPTPMLSTDPPDPDPITGRDDYSDVERITSVLYAVVEEDLFGRPVVHRDNQGNLVNGLKYIQENLNTAPPENSYILEAFERPEGPIPDGSP